MRELRSLMRTYGLKTAEVAFFLDLKPQTVRAMRCGVRRISAKQLAAIRRAVGALV